MITDSLKAAPFLGALSFFSPAKINLFFRVLFKRGDGFHEISSKYQAVSLFDTLWVALAEEDSFSCSDPNLSLGQTNLVTKALSLFRQETGSTSCFRIHLDKKIPQEAGLGGGSSNAATALWAFTSLVGMQPNEELLKKWGAKLGSDVPFFFSRGTALVSGRGDLVENLPLDQNESFWIAKPKWGLPTPKVYGAMAPFLENSQKFIRSAPFYNDLEGPAFFLSPPLKDLKDKLLDSGFDSVTLCGSGTSLFCSGNKKPPVLSDVEFFHVRSIYRREKSWYEL